MAVATQYSPHRELDAQLKAAGCSKTVYALVTPETEAVKRDVLGIDSPEANTAYMNLFREAWTGKQEAVHETFFEVWRDWASPILHIEQSQFPLAYPTAGASEALFHLIADYGNRARAKKFIPVVHIFAGEYEGYKAYAEAGHIEVVEHDRDDWHSAAAAFKATDMFFISQPSSIDGMFWADLNSFLQLISQNGDVSNVVVDATYVGATARPLAQKIAVDQPCVAAVVFSLSKPFGTYYDRIGGVFCRTENLGLFGNKWFKNLTSLSIGTELMRKHDVFDFGRRYASQQAAACDSASLKFGLPFVPSDVFVLATARSDSQSQLAQYLRRPANLSTGKLRICLTPAMALAIGTSGPYGKS